MSKKLVVVILGAFIVAGIASYAGAFNEPIPTKVGIQRGYFPASHMWKLVAKAPDGYSFPIPDCNTSNPASLGGRLELLGDTMGHSWWSLPSGGDWKLLGQCLPGKHRGYKYRAPVTNGSAPVKVLIVKERVIKVLAKVSRTESIDFLEPPIDPGLNAPAYIHLKVGNDAYCAGWGYVDGYSREVSGKLLKEKDEPAPPHCASFRCTENGDDPQCAYSDPCTDGTCAISGNVCVTYADCPYFGEECCCHGTCL